MNCARSVSRWTCSAAKPYDPASALAATFSFQPLIRRHYSVPQQAIQTLETEVNRPLSIPRGPSSFDIFGVPHSSRITQPIDISPEQWTILAETIGAECASTIIELSSKSESDEDIWRPRMRMIAQLYKTIRAKPLHTMHEIAREILPQLMQYEGAVPPSMLNLPDPHEASTRPWASGKEELKRYSSALGLLEDEMFRFGEFIRPSSVEQVARTEVFRQTKLIIQAALGPDFSVENYGSEMTGLATAVSDLDFRVYLSDQTSQSDDREVVLTGMQKLSVAVEEGSHFSNIYFRQGRFPTVQCTHQESGLDIQINATAAADPQHNAALEVLDEIPHLKSLYFILHTTLAIRGLKDVSHGGLGSYSLLMMIAAALRRMASVLDVSQPGAALLHVLHFYAAFDTRSRGISVYPSQLFPVATKPAHRVRVAYAEAACRRDDPVRAGQWSIRGRHAQMPYLLCVQDPADPDNDLTQRSFAIKYILATLRQLYVILVNRLNEFDRDRAEGQPARHAAFLDVLVGASDAFYHDRRVKLERFGSLVMEEQKAEAKTVESGG